MALKCLTVKQPWAHMIAHCGKTVENRSRPTGHRGLLAIHAGAFSGWDRHAESSPVLQDAWQRWAVIPDICEPGPLSRVNAPIFLAFGAVVAVTEVTGCHFGPDFGGTCGATRPMCSPWAVRDFWHWELSNVRSLPEPVPCKGALGLWRLTEDIEQAVRSQIQEASS